MRRKLFQRLDMRIDAVERGADRLELKMQRGLDVGDRPVGAADVEHALAGAKAAQDIHAADGGDLAADRHALDEIGRMEGFELGRLPKRTRGVAGVTAGSAARSCAGMATAAGTDACVTSCLWI